MNDVDRKLKILFASSDKYPPFRPAARAIFLEQFQSRGHYIDFLLQAERACPKPKQVRLKHGNVYVGATDDGTSRWRRARKHLLDIFNDLRIFRLVKNNDYDIIQVKDKYLVAIIGLLLARLYGVRFTFWLAYPHAEASLYSVEENTARYPLLKFIRGHLLKFLLYKIIIPGSDHVFVQSEQMKQDVSVYGVPLEKMTPVPGSVNLDHVPYEQKSTQQAEEKEQRIEFSIVYLGTLLRVRRLDFLIQVLAVVRQRYPSAKLYLVGAGDQIKDGEFLKQEALRLGVENEVIFTGFLPMEKAWKLVKDADLCVSPYYPTPILNSTSPTKLVEYMAMGKAVIANDHPEQKLVIAESGAGLCVPWDVTAFADAIVSLLDDTELLEEMGRKGRAYVEKHRTSKALADSVEERYFEICSNKSKKQQNVVPEKR
jgi:glycosyltransferase involved in cell wall biosynthesis